MLLTSQRDTKNRIVKNAQMLLSAVVKLIFFLFKNIFQYLVHAPFFSKIKKKIHLPFVTLLEIPCISQVFLLSKMCSKMAYTDRMTKCIYLKSSLSAHVFLLDDPCF